MKILFRSQHCRRVLFGGQRFGLSRRWLTCLALLLVVGALSWNGGVTPLYAQDAEASAQAVEPYQLHIPLLQGSTLAPEDDTQTDNAQSEATDSETIFRADFETGNLNQWRDGGVISTSGYTKANVNTKIVYKGRYAAALTIYNADGTNPAPGVRLGWNAAGHVDPSDPKNLPDTAYYSAHYYFPRQVTTEWWNIMQWKQALLESDGGQTRIPVYFVSVVSKDNKMYLVLRSKVDAQGRYTEPGTTAAYRTTPIATQSWMRLECLYKWSKQADGRIACWQNGTLIWDVNNIITEFDIPYKSYPRQWTINNYAAKTNPISPVLYIDDAAIRTQPLGAP